MKRFIIILLLATALRLWVAPMRGHVHDITQLKAWSYTAASGDPLTIYSNSTANYPPLAILPLTLMGKLFQVLWPGLEPSEDLFTALIKVPALAADLLTVVVIYYWLKKRAGERTALLFATAYAFNPAVCYTSAWWGQLEALYTLPMLLAVMDLEAGRPTRAWAWLAVAILVKPQAAVVVPILLIDLFSPQRHRPWHCSQGHVIHGAKSDSQSVDSSPLKYKANKPSKPGLSQTLSASGKKTRRALRLGGKMIHSLSTAVAVFVVVLAPFAGVGQLPALWAQLEASAGRQDFLSMNAHNLWYLLTLGRGSFAARAADPILDTRPLLGSLTGWQMGLLILAGWTVLVGWAYWRGRQSGSSRPLNYLAPAAMVLGFYMLPAESHERYLFPALALLLPALPSWRAGRWLYLTLSITLFLNLLWVDPALPLPHFAEQLTWGVPIALVNTACLLWVAWMLYRPRTQ